MDVNEVESIMSDLAWLQKNMPVAINNWQTTKPNCDYHTGMIKEICQSPGKLNREIFDPLIKWLADYVLNRQGKIAFAGPNGLDNFLRLGLRLITNFVVISDFFAKNPSYFVPTPPISSGNLANVKKATEQQAQYKEFLNLLSSKLIGCNEKLNFIFLKLSRTINNLTDDLKRMQEYLNSQCLSYRISGLKQ